jgi:hypothetical protein
MRKLLIGISALGVTAGCVGLVAWAESPQQPKEAPTGVAPAPGSTAKSNTNLPAGKFEVTPVPGASTFTIHANKARIVDLLRSIAEKASYKMLVSDDVEAEKDKYHVSTLNATTLSADQAIQRFAAVAYVVGKIGKDTYLVVRAPLQTQFALSSPHVSPPRIVPKRVPEVTPPPKAKPFDFNGHRYYYVPLTPKDAPASTQQVPASNGTVRKAR